MIVIPALHLKYGRAEEYGEAREIPQSPELATLGRLKPHTMRRRNYGHLGQLEVGKYLRSSNGQYDLRQGSVNALERLRRNCKRRINSHCAGDR